MSPLKAERFLQLVEEEEARNLKRRGDWSPDMSSVADSKMEKPRGEKLGSLSEPRVALMAASEETDLRSAAAGAGTRPAVRRSLEPAQSLAQGMQPGRCFHFSLVPRP